MKFLKNKYFAVFCASLVILIITSFFILSSSIPDNVFVSRSEIEDGWISPKFSWITTSRCEPHKPAMENMSEKKSDVSQSEEYNATVYLCGVIPVKTVNLCVTDNMYVTVGGDCIGIDLKTYGVLVVGIEGFESVESVNVSPGKDAGFKKGDIIEKMNGIIINNISDVQNIIRDSPEFIRCEGKSGSKQKEWTIYPETDKNGNVTRLGIWLRESVAGVGTLTFYYNNAFAALGHPIADSDTGKMVSESGGTICSATVIGIDKGKKGVPGAIKGIFSDDERGNIKINSKFGIYGTVSSVPVGEKVKVSGRRDVRPGKAEIVCDIGNGKATYNAEIQKVFPTSNDTKSMVIRITDKELIEKTGGIVQGMSGSPVLQNGKIVGAVTHVFVNDPTRGYGIFIENMLAEAEKISD